MAEKMKEQKSKFITLLFVIVVLVFLYLIRPYIVPLIMAAIFSGISYPYYRRLVVKMKGRTIIPAIVILTIFFLVIVIPTSILGTMVLNEATSISQKVVPMVQGKDTNDIVHSLKIPDWLPFADELRPFKEDILTKVSEVLGSIGQWFMKSLTSLTQGTLSLLLNTFIMFYAMFFFLLKGNDILDTIPKFIPLNEAEFDHLIENAFSVSRATLKGAIFIGVIQGFLVGVAFAVLGIPGAILWGTVAALFSVIPSVGSGLVWVPAAAYLMLSGSVGAGIGLIVWGGLIVGSVDNLLRPKLVGDDTQIPDLIILVTTLGGIGLFGISGLILGPVIAGLLMTIAELYKTDAKGYQRRRSTKV